MDRSFIRIQTKKPGIIPQYSNPQSAARISRDDNFIMKKNLDNSRNKKNNLQLVYSTGSGEMSLQKKLSVRIDNKHRGGKTVTLVEGFIIPENRIEELAKTLKSKCGTGGTVKDRMIIMQGNLKERIEKILLEEGYQID